MLSLQPLVALASAARTSTRLPESAAMLGRLMITRDRVIKAVRDRPVQNGEPQVLAVDDIMSFALAILLSMINASSALQIATTRMSLYQFSTDTRRIWVLDPRVYLRLPMPIRRTPRRDSRKTLQRRGRCQRRQRAHADLPARVPRLYHRTTSGFG